ncbi:barstar family protein [Pendulispora albinea]|uniref:Barstar family protein n=1 Tax=Pendulispora albinea TaxID=2741071 RepID=A0ABZ2M0L4_9BACT
MSTSDLLKPGPPSIAQWIAPPDTVSTAIWKLRGETAAARTFIGTLRGKRMRTRQGVFDQFGALLQFPTYFGENWDAFLDCMRDLDWLRASGFVLVVFDAADVLADADAGELDTLLQILTEAAEAWEQGDDLSPPTPFHIILQTTAERAPELRAKLTRHAPAIPVLELRDAS